MQPAFWAAKNKRFFIRRYKQERDLSVAELAEELHIAKSALEIYLKGEGNPRADTIDYLAKQCGVSAVEMISAYPLEPGRAEILERAVKIFGDLPPERRESAISHFLALIGILGENA